MRMRRPCKDMSIQESSSGYQKNRNSAKNQNPSQREYPGLTTHSEGSKQCCAIGIKSAECAAKADHCDLQQINQGLMSLLPGFPVSGHCLWYFVDRLHPCLAPCASKAFASIMLYKYTVFLV
jgi:hypothetical protein